MLYALRSLIRGVQVLATISRQGSFCVCILLFSVCGIFVVNLVPHSPTIDKRANPDSAVRFGPWTPYAGGSPLLGGGRLTRREPTTLHSVNVTNKVKLMFNLILLD